MHPGGSPSFPLPVGMPSSTLGIADEIDFGALWMIHDLSIPVALNDPVAAALSDLGNLTRMENVARAFLGKGAGVSSTQRTEEAKAIVQEAAFRALKRRDRFDSTKNVLNWLVGFVMNVVREEWKKRRCNKTGPPGDGHPLDELAVDRSRRVEEMFADKLLVDHLLDQLPALDRQILRLKFNEDLTFAEIGQRVEMNECAVRVRAFRAIEKLQRLCAVTGEGQS